jgi:peptidoglycan/xylan/chitin deacetylase (PgdA/CDA1 family)
MRQYFNWKTLGLIIIITLIFFGVRGALSSNPPSHKASADKSNQTSPFVESSKIKSENTKNQSQNLPKIADQKISYLNPITYDIWVPILMYHHIVYFPQSQQTNLDGLYVYTHNFDAQMAYLKLNRYDVISLDVLYQGLEKGKGVPEKSVVLTFDDGYSDFYFDAFPILKKYGFTATVFIITGKVGTAGYLNWRQIRELADNGMTIGAHTVGHVNLATESSVVAENQITKSREDLEFALKQKIKFFSYPAGGYNTSLFKYLEENNFLAAVTTENGDVTIDSQLYQLPRKRVNGKYVGLYGLDHFASLLK